MMAKLIEYSVNQRGFYIWKLERWWVAFNAIEFRPAKRKHLIGNWYLRI